MTLDKCATATGLPPDPDKQASPDMAARSSAMEAQSASAAVTEQTGLFPEGAGDVSDALPRMFFPCNREDALVLLGSLCISASFPERTVRLPLDDDDIALVESGLRASEGELLENGEARRFPLLVEVSATVAGREPRIIGYEEIVRLVFKTQNEADDFRYRPVDELDTETFECQVDPACFALQGSPRFALRDADGPERVRAGRVADRITAAVGCILSLGDAQPECRPAIARFLEPPEADTTFAEINLTNCWRTLANDAPGPSARFLRAIIDVFINADDPTPRSLIDDIADRFASEPPDDAGGREVEARWIAVARDVAASRTALNGDLLSDARSVLLRAALLAIAAENSAALSSFLQGDKPSGVRVTTAAAFLIGLKHGLISTPWRFKTDRAKQLSFLAATLLRAIAEPFFTAAIPIALSNADEDHLWILRVSAGGRKLVEWKTEGTRLPDAIEEAWLADFRLLGYEVSDKGLSRYSWMLQLPEGRRVELVHCTIGEFRFPMLRMPFADKQKLRKAKDIGLSFGSGGRLWYPRRDDKGAIALCCDLPSLPAQKDLAPIVAALDEAVKLAVSVGSAPKRKSGKAGVFGFAHPEDLVPGREAPRRKTAS